jgi:hypothetical protein
LLGLGSDGAHHVNEAIHVELALGFGRFNHQRFVHNKLLSATGTSDPSKFWYRKWRDDDNSLLHK